MKLSEEKTVCFKNEEISDFSLKYLAKFIVNHGVDNLSINGGYMPLNDIKYDKLVLFDLSNQGLFSEDLFILSQFLKMNTSITHINLSNNSIGYKHYTNE